MSIAEDKKVAELLIKRGVITGEQLKKAAEFRATLGGGSIRDIVVKLGYAKDRDISAAIAAEGQVGAIEIKYEMVDPKLMEKIPRKVCEKHSVVPLRSAGHSVVLAMADPMDYQAIEEIQFLTNMTIEPVVAPKNAIRRALQQYDQMKAAAEESAATETDSGGDLDSLTTDQLLRAFIACMIEKQQLTVEELMAKVPPSGDA